MTSFLFVAFGFVMAFSLLLATCGFSLTVYSLSTCGSIYWRTYILEHHIQSLNVAVVHSSLEVYLENVLHIYEIYLSVIFN